MADFDIFLSAFGEEMLMNKESVLISSVLQMKPFRALLKSSVCHRLSFGSFGSGQKEGRNANFL